MISKRDVQLGKIALKEGFISKEQLTKCLALKKKLAKEKGKKVALGALLLKKGYLTKDQLEECVKLHNKSVDGEEDAEKKKRRSKRTKAAPADASEETAEKPTKRSSKKKKAGGEEEDASEASTATATKTKSKSRSSKADPKSKTSGRSKRSRRSQRTSRDAKRKRKDASEDGDVLESAVEAVDPAIFASALETDGETDTRRLIACPECGKKYRVKQNQVGRRFSCRRCDHRIKVPKDLFDRESEISEVHPAVEVEEFVLGSGDGTVEESSAEAPALKGKKGKAPLGKKGGRKKASLAEAAAQAAAAVEKVSGQPSIADLAANAANFKAKPLSPKKKFTARDLLTMLVSAAALAGIVFGGYHFFVVRPREEAEKKKAERLDREFKKFQDPIDQALADADQAIKAKDPRALGNAREVILQRMDTEPLVGPTKVRAEAYLKEKDIPNRVREAMVLEGKLYLEKGGLEATRGLDVLKKALALPGIGEDIRLQVAQLQVEYRQYKVATQILEEATGAGAQALLGLAWERGGVAAKARKAYESLDDKLAKVLEARADLVEGNPKAALNRLQGASGLEGPDQAAAKIVEALAFEADKKLDQASSAFDRAVANAGENPIPRAARAEFFIRQGKYKEALADANASPCPRGILAKGDALLGLLDLDAAMAAYKEAAAAPPFVPKRLVANYVDPFAAPSPFDPSSVARCRLAQIYFAQERYSEAQEAVQEAMRTGPNEPIVLATFALLPLLQEQQGSVSLYLDRAVELCTKIRPDKTKPYLSSPQTGYVLWVKGLESLQETRLDVAIEYLEAAADYDANLVGPCNVLAGRAYDKKGQRSHALRAWLKAAERERKDPSVALLRKKIQAGGLGLPKIEKQVHALLTRNPYHGLALVLRSDARLRAGKSKEALADASAAVVVNPGLREAFLHRAMLVMRDLPQELRSPETGARDVAAALALEGGGDRALLSYAQALVAWSNSGDSGKVKEHLDNCISADPKFAWAYDLKAKLLEQLNKKDEAAEARKTFESLRSSSK